MVTHTGVEVSASTQYDEYWDAWAHGARRLDEDGDYSHFTIEKRFYRASLV